MEEEKEVKEVKVKKSKQKKMIIIMAIIILFFAINVYAGTMGYKNIFFAINNFIKPNKEVTDSNEILSDRDTTISYQSIEIASGLNIQINRLVVQDNDATLYINIDESSASVIPARCLVYDTSGSESEGLIGNEEILHKMNESRYDLPVELVGMKNSTNLLQIEFQDSSYNSIAVLELDLQNKDINIISGETTELEKISEVELKEVLANYIRIFMYEDLNAVETRFHTPQEYRNEQEAVIAFEYYRKNNQTYQANVNEIHKIIKEFTGENITNRLDLSNITLKYNEDQNEYEYINKYSEPRKALCLDVTNITYKDGIYKATFIYCYPTEDDYKYNNIENLDQFEATMELSINKEYNYAKYRIVNLDAIERNSTIGNDDIFTDIDDDNTIYVTPSPAVTPRPTATPLPTASPLPTVTPMPFPTASPLPQNVDNYASTMSWSTLYTPGLKSVVPSDWSVDINNQYYTGNNDGELAATVKGQAIGIDRETNEILVNDMTFEYMVPEFVDCTNVDEYCKMIAERYGAVYDYAGYSDNKGNITWGCVGYLNQSEQETEQKLYCHFEKLDDGSRGIGYLIIEYCSGPSSYKTLNIENWMFGRIKTTSF